MPSTAVQRRFNAADYRDDAMDLVKTNPAAVVDSMTKLARRKHNQDKELQSAEEATKNLMAFLGATAVMALVGWWNGNIQAKRDAMIAEWEESGAESVGANLTDQPEPWDSEMGARDPNNWWMIPKLLLVPVVALAISLFIGSRRSQNKPAGVGERMFGTTAISSFAYFIANVTSNMAYKRKVKRIDAGTEQVVAVRTGT